MSDDMRLLILTHLRAAMERKDWSSAHRAMMTAHLHGAEPLTDRLFDALLAKDWRAVEAVYVSLGGMGCGEPGKSPGDPEKARDGVCGGVVVPADALKRARGSAAAPDGWSTLGNVR